MKKFAKMSLVAALAVAGLSSTVSAQPLAEAVKNVDVFGYVSIRYNEKAVDGGAHSAQYQHKTVIGATGALNDSWSYMGAYTGFNMDNTNTINDYGDLVDEIGETAGLASFETGLDGQGFLMVYNYFIFNGVENLAVNIGKSGLFSPLTVGYDPATSTSEGNGVVATYKAPAGVTATLGYMAHTNFGIGDAFGSFIASGNQIVGQSYVHAGITGKAGPVALDLWYGNMEDVYDTVSVGASGSFDAGSVKITPSARFTSLTLENDSAVTGDDKNSLWKVGVKAKSGIFGASLDYAETDKDGGLVAFDNDAAASLKGWTQTINGKADAEMLKASVGVDLGSQFNLSYTFVEIDQEGAANDIEENIAMLKYKPSSNFSAYLKFEEVELADNSEYDQGRLAFLWMY